MLRTAVCVPAHVIFVVLLCIRNIEIVSSAKTKQCALSPDTKSHAQGICGKDIPNVLRLICGKGGYVEKSYIKKRSIDSDVVDGEDDGNYNFDPSALKDVVYSKRDASTFLNKRVSYYQQGISCECCYHKCSIRELASYCKDGKARGLAILSMMDSRLGG